jgi:hypothetical protein
MATHSHRKCSAAAMTGKYMNIKLTDCSTWWVRIYLAGDIEIAKQVCREVCFEDGLCVTVEPCEYIYTGGQEAGYCVGLINYPRFPADHRAITERANRLAERLMAKGCQHSALVMTPETTEWYTCRDDG